MFLANASNHVHQQTTDHWKISSHCQHVSYCLFNQKSPWLLLMQADWVSFLSPSMLTHFPYHHFTEVTLTKGNHVKLTREFCGLNYLNSPELLYRQLPSVSSGSTFECVSRNVCLTMQLLEFSRSRHHREDHAVTWMLCGAQQCFLVSRPPSRLPGRALKCMWSRARAIRGDPCFCCNCWFCSSINQIQAQTLCGPRAPAGPQWFSHIMWTNSKTKPCLSVLPEQTC